MTRRRLVISAVLVCLLIVGGIAIARTFTTQNKEGAGVDTLQVSTDGLSGVIPQLPSIKEESINTSLMGVIRKNVAEPKDAYNAVYRDGSIQRSQSSTGAPIISFLVDIPDLQRTFRIDIEGNDETPSKTIYALCPLPGQSAYGERECNDTP